MTGAPMIDILLAVYNGERYLPDFLESLLAQTHSDFRLVVSDNKSTDGTRRVLDRYAHRFRNGVVILPLPEQTVPAARNFARAVDVAQAPYIMYADADDVWYPDKVERTFVAMRAAEARHGAHTPLLVHSDLAVVDRDLRTLHPSYWAYQDIDPARTGLRQMLMRNCVTGCTVMMNRALCELATPIPHEALMHDYWCALNAAAFGFIETIGEPLIAYRQHGANDIGASPWGVSHVVRRLSALSSSKGPRARLRGKVAQAGVLLARHGDRLGVLQRDAVEAMAGLFEAGFLARRWYVVRHGLWDDGFTRNIGLFLFL